MCGHLADLRDRAGNNELRCTCPSFLVEAAGYLVGIERIFIDISNFLHQYYGLGPDLRQAPSGEPPCCGV